MLRQRECPAYYSVSAYYNEIDAEKAAWIRELIKRGAVAPGEVDERSMSGLANPNGGEFRIGDLQRSGQHGLLAQDGGAAERVANTEHSGQFASEGLRPTLNS